MTKTSTVLDVATLAARIRCSRRSQGKRVRQGIRESTQEGRRVTLDFGLVATLDFAFMG